MKKTIYFNGKTDQKIILLSALYVTSLLANLAMGYRYINLGLLTQSGGIFIFPISFIISDIIAEVYGAELAKRLITYGITCQLIFAIYAFFIIRIPAPEFLNNKNAYYIVFNAYLTFAMASSISIWIGTKTNIFLLGRLSEYAGGKYFALRSFLASTIGELLVTIISMCLANFEKISLDNLVYMIMCCFFVKTIISFIAIWPAALVVLLFENPPKVYDLFSIEQISNPLKFLKTLFINAWNAKGYMYSLESINIPRRKANLYFKGSRGGGPFYLHKLISDFSIINKMKAEDAAHIGYYSAFIKNSDSKKTYCNDNIASNNHYNLNKGLFNIQAISRDGKLIIEDIRNAVIFKKTPLAIYRNQGLIEQFSRTQALYIGYLAGLSEYAEKYDESNELTYLQLIK